MAASMAVRWFSVRERKCRVKCTQTLATLFSTKTGVGVSRAEGLHKDETENKKTGSKSLRDLIAERQAQAERSILISCHPKTHENNFLKYLSSHGNINKCFFYESFGTYALVEFSDQEGVWSLLESAAIPSSGHDSVVPLRSRLLSLRNTNIVGKNQSAPRCQPQKSVPINQLIQQLSSCPSLQQQIVLLTGANSLTDENTRLRFLVCSLLNDIATTCFPKSLIKPFGSSVNGFGKLDGDLDIFLDLEGNAEGSTNERGCGMFLEYQMKSFSSEREVNQSVLAVIAECLQQFGPGCFGVQRILNARCPLVRFTHRPSGIQCDLTSRNSVAMRATELLYLYGELDSRVRPMVFTVRCWARTHGVTSSTSGAWITNFSLTIMVLFFLQRRNPPILPTLEQLKKLAEPSETYVVDGHDCTFTTDFHKISLEANTETLEELLCEFFEFYSTFDFKRMAINFRMGKEEDKPEAKPLYIKNFFQRSLNISQNVNLPQLERFVLLCQESLWLLQSEGNLSTLLQPTNIATVKRRTTKKKEIARNRIKQLLGDLRTNDNGQKKESQGQS